MTLESGIKKDERSFYIPTQIEIPKTSIKQWILKADNLTFNEKYKEYSNLQSVKVFGVVSVGEECFSGCSALETFEADKFTSIGQKAFYGCTSLEKIQIKEGIDSIGKSFLAETKGTLSQCPLAGMDACNRAGGDGDIRSYRTMGISR